MVNYLKVMKRKGDSVMTIEKTIKKSGVAEVAHKVKNILAAASAGVAVNVACLYTGGRIMAAVLPVVFPNAFAARLVCNIVAIPLCVGAGLAGAAVGNAVYEALEENTDYGVDLRDLPDALKESGISFASEEGEAPA